MFFYMYTAHTDKYSTLTSFTVNNIWLVYFIDFIDFKTLSPQYLKTTWQILMKFTHIIEGVCRAYIPIFKWI